MKKILDKHKACLSGKRWALSQPDLESAWDKCHRGDWLLWAAQRCDVNIKKMTMAKVECARLVQPLMSDSRSIEALDVAEKFSLGEATLEELSYAADAAYAAAARDRILLQCAGIVRECIAFEDLGIES